MNPLAETFHINNNINLYLLNAIPEEHLKDISSSKGRNVGEQFAHMHNVRLMWLQAADPELLKGLEKIDKEKGISKIPLMKSLEVSAKAIENLLEKSDGKIKGFKPHAAAFLGYLSAHEGHHRGQILLCLKQSGHMVDKKIQFGIWEWGSRS
ncbi:MAG TPA: DinB family protein [Chitinophagaceae bacterium]|nr:DinB family protein [Chitinophagaceae bacterium]